MSLLAGLLILTNAGAFPLELGDAGSFDLRTSTVREAAMSIREPQARPDEPPRADEAAPRERVSWRETVAVDRAGRNGRRIAAGVRLSVSDDGGSIGAAGPVGKTLMQLIAGD